MTCISSKNLFTFVGDLLINLFYKEFRQKYHLLFHKKCIKEQLSCFGEKYIADIARTSRELQYNNEKINKKFFFIVEFDSVLHN